MSKYRVRQEGPQEFYLEREIENGFVWGFMTLTRTGGH